MRRLGAALGTLVLLAALVGAAPVGAEEESYYYELWNGLMSPFCPGRSLMDCSSGEAAELRDWIRVQDEAGQSRNAVEEALYERFGDTILQAPRAEGWGLAAYVVPLVAAVVGGGIVVLFLTRQRRNARTTPSAAPEKLEPVDPELERMLEDELRDAS